MTDAKATADVLTRTMGYRLVAEEGPRTRYTVAAGGPGSYVDLLTDPALPRGLNGAGTIHHVAFRTPDGQVVIVLANTQNFAQSVGVKIGARNLSAKLPPKSFNTLCLAMPSVAGTGTK